jgi:hypothetical protein
MRVKITPEYDEKIAPHYFYKAVLRGEPVVAAGDTWEEAKQRIKDKLAQLCISPDAPAEEEIEL